MVVVVVATVVQCLLRAAFRCERDTRHLSQQAKQTTLRLAELAREQQLLQTQPQHRRSLKELLDSQVPGLLPSASRIARRLLSPLRAQRTTTRTTYPWAYPLREKSTRSSRPSRRPSPHQSWWETQQSTERSSSIPTVRRRINLISKRYDNAAQLLGTQQTRYRIATNGALTIVSIDIQFSTTSSTHLVLTKS